MLSKGHASVLLYSWLKTMGAITDNELLGYAQLDSRLEGHPRPVLPWVDVATGSLGQGLAAAVGLALSMKKLEKSPPASTYSAVTATWCEGSIWEAFEHAAHWGLNNMIVMIDVNGLGQRGPTMVGQQTGAARRPGPCVRAGRRWKSTVTTWGRSTPRSVPPRPRPTGQQ